jgi:hypothetical protein
METHRVETSRLPHFLDSQLIDGSEVVSLTRWLAATLPPGRFLLLISVWGWVNPRVTVWLEGLSQLKNPMTSSGIKPMTFQLVAKCLSQLSYHMAPAYNISLPNLWKLQVDEMPLLNSRSFSHCSTTTAFNVEEIPLSYSGKWVVVIKLLRPVSEKISPIIKISSTLH